MNFEEAFKHCQEGTATQTEKEFVADELAKAKALSSLFDDEGVNVTPAPIAEADKREIKAAKKRFQWKKLVYAFCAIAATLLIIAAVLGGVFGSAAAYANENIVYGEGACVQFAKEYAFNFLNDPNGIYPGSSFISSPDDLIVDDVDKKFNYDEKRIKKSYYVYRVELKAGGLSIEVEVDTRFPNACVLHEIN